MVSTKFGVLGLATYTLEIPNISSETRALVGVPNALDAIGLDDFNVTWRLRGWM